MAGGFNSLDDYLYQVTHLNNTSIEHIDKFINPDDAGNGYVRAAWKDLFNTIGYPARHVYGDYVYNGNFDCGLLNWTSSSSTYLYSAAATGIVNHIPGSATSDTLTQNVLCSSGITYSVAYTIASYAGSGNIQASLGGTAGTANSADGEYRETLMCGETTTTISGVAYAPLVITFDNTVSCTIDNVSVIKPMTFKPYDANVQYGLYSGEWTSGSKFISNFTIGSNTSTYGCVMIVDVLGVYPRIELDVNGANEVTLQTPAPLPRYTDGDGVMAYAVFNSVPATITAGSTFIAFKYTNSTGVSGRTSPCLLSIGGTIGSTGAVIYNTAGIDGDGPFIPLYPGDAGILKIDTMQLDENVTAGTSADLVLCRPLVYANLSAANYSNTLNYITGLMSLPEVKNGAKLGIIHYHYTASAVDTLVPFSGCLNFAWGESH